MKHLLCLFAATLLAAHITQAQTLKSVVYNSTNDTVVQTQRIIFPRLGVAQGTAAVPSISYASGTNSFGTFASTALGVGPYLGFSVDGLRRFYISTNAIRAELPMTFANAAETRTNLGVAQAPIYKFKSTNQTNATTNLVSDSALTFTAAANTKYLVTASVGFEFDSDSSMRGKVLAPSNATVYGKWTTFVGSLGTTALFPSSVSVSNEYPFITEHDGFTYVPQQFVVATGTNGGSVTFQFAGTNAGVILPAGSWLKAEVIE